MTLGSVLVVGGTGFIGSALVRRLVREGARVRCAVRPESPRAEALRELGGIELVALDELAAGRGEQHELVFNLASYGVNPDDRDPIQMIEGNVTLLARVLGALDASALRRFVHVGSCSEYAPTDPPALLGEDQPLEPTSIYGAAKAAAHVFGTALARGLGIDFVTLRLFGTYGAGEAEHRLIPHLAARLRRGESGETTSGEQYRDFTHVDDVVEALLMAAQCERLAPYRAYNVCSGVPVRIRDVAEMVARVLGQPIERLGLGRRPMRPGETPWIVGDPTRFRAAAGWQPALDLEAGVRRALEAA